MMDGLTSLYSWRYPRTIIYMLQSCEYQVLPYLRWYWQTNNFSRVAHRRQLQQTRAARLLLLVMYSGLLAELLIGIFLIWPGREKGVTGAWEFGVALIIAAPVVWAQLIALPLIVGRFLIVRPRTYFQVKRSERIFRDHPGVKIAVAGSYGKTSMKELLTTVLSTSKKVAATPGNKNVAVSHAYFAQQLTGDEDIVIIEYGEGGPGDVVRFTLTTHPTHAVITGLAPAHLDRYKTVQAAGEDIFAVADYVKHHQVYVNAESPQALPFIKKQFERYSAKGALGWTVSHIMSEVTGLSFTMSKGGKTMHLSSGLVGRHQVGPLALVAALAKQLGMEIADIEQGVATTMPFEHRMQPYPLNGAWIIDDTYNGNIEGIRVGTELFKELPAKRKIYVTPGLVDQGVETPAVHETMGYLIAKAAPDMVVLMQHSVTKYIHQGLTDAGYKGEVVVETDPLTFYTNIGLFVAAGDLVLMQNDWPDNYA
jgi:UDP-N-acetylmuramoyl-tripeptide--D-alanyl-D-alanine ligase